MSKSPSNKSELTNLPEITEIIKYALVSDYVQLDDREHEAPLSPILVAPPEEGKTAVVKQFDPTNGLLFIDNVTAWGLEHRYIKELQSGRIKRLVIPDFIDPTNRKKATVDSTITFFNKFISWEGIKEVQTYAMDLSLETPLRGSLLTTMAIADFLRMVKSLAAVGFLSRLIVIGYQYSEIQRDTLLEDIVYKRAGWDNISLNLPKENTPVELNPDISIKMKPLAKLLGQRAGGGGIRAMHQLEIMAKSKALYEGRDVVTENDIFRVMYLAERYINNVIYDSKTRNYLKSVEVEK